MGIGFNSLLHKTGSARPLWTRHDRAGSPDAPLSSRAFAENLKLYAKQANIDEIHIHQTRHTYARVVAEEISGYQETQEALDHENAATTRVYVQPITLKTNKHSSKIARCLKLPGYSSIAFVTALWNARIAICQGSRFSIVQSHNESFLVRASYLKCCRFGTDTTTRDCLKCWRFYDIRSSYY